MRRLFLTGISFFIISYTYSQDTAKYILPGVIIDGDTLPSIVLKDVIILGWKSPGKSEERKMTKLMKNVKIVYPYARLAGIKLDEYEEILAQAPDDRARRQIMKQVEDELEAEYGQELRDLTVTQGKILLKLVDRETGESSYELVSDLRGEFRALFYQAFARIFGMNMKVRYDPEGEDKDIEIIVQMIENGQL
jgi:hypothetical protein